MSDAVSCAFLGGDMKAYYNSGTIAAPVYVEIDEAIDVSIPDFNDTMAEVATRSGSFAYNKPAKTRLAVEMSYLYRANDTVWQYLKGQKLAKEIIDLWVLDGPTDKDGTEGLHMYCYMEQFPVGQALEEVATHDTLRFSPGYVCDAQGNKLDPAWVTFTAGVPSADAMSMDAGVSGTRRLSPVIANQLMRSGRIKRVQATQAMTVKNVMKLHPDVKELIQHMPPDMVVHVPPTARTPSPPVT